jgi:hypothetical protein
MGEVIIIDVWKANQLLDEQRRVIEEVARRCFLKGKPEHFHVCPLREECEAQNSAHEEKNHAGPY